MKRIVAALLTLAMSVGIMAGAASADHGIQLMHWNRFVWGGVAYAGNYRSVYVYDRSGDSTVAAALQEFVAAWNNNMVALGWQANLPIFQYIQQWDLTGQCARSSWHIPGYSLITVCADGSSGGVTYTTNAHGDQYQPNIFIGRYYSDYNTTFSLIAHEMGHAMGLTHSGDPANLMYPTVTVGQKKWFSAHDLQVCGDFYYGHPVH